MSDFVAATQALTIAEDWLTPLRERGRSCWQAWSLPTRKTEAWKYTSLSSVLKPDYRFDVSAPSNDVDAQWKIDDLDANVMVFVDGVFSARLSELDERELSVCRFSEADATQQALIESELNAHIDLEQQGFAALNTQTLGEGVLVHVAAAAQPDKALHIVWVSSSPEQATYCSARVLVVVESGAQAQVIEHYVGSPSAEVLTNSVTELVLRDNARLTYYRLHEEAGAANHIGGVHAVLGRAAHLDSFFLTFGSDLKRLDIVVHHRGEGGESYINGVYLPREKQHIDVHTSIEHAVPHCNSNETFRGIVADSARAVFNGRIHIHRDAQKTEAYLSNKNLLTSNKAEVDTKPELEIYADDVRCAHGATVAQLDKEAVHYLKTRGVSQEEALVMLSFGFINELFTDLSIPAVGNYARPKLAALFARESDLTRHLL